MLLNYLNILALGVANLFKKVLQCKLVKDLIQLNYYSRVIILNLIVERLEDNRAKDRGYVYQKGLESTSIVVSLSRGREQCSYQVIICYSNLFIAPYSQNLYYLYISLYYYKLEKNSIVVYSSQASRAIQQDQVRNIDLLYLIRHLLLLITQLLLDLIQVVFLIILALNRTLTLFNSLVFLLLQVFYSLIIETSQYLYAVLVILIIKGDRTLDYIYAQAILYYISQVVVNILEERAIIGLYILSIVQVGDKVGLLLEYCVVDVVPKVTLNKLLHY